MDFIMAFSYMWVIYFAHIYPVLPPFCPAVIHFQRSVCVWSVFVCGCVCICVGCVRSLIWVSFGLIINRSIEWGFFFYKRKDIIPLFSGNLSLLVNFQGGWAPCEHLPLPLWNVEGPNFVQVNLDLVMLRGQSDTKFPFCCICILPTTKWLSFRALYSVIILLLEPNFQLYGFLITSIFYESLI